MLSRQMTKKLFLQSRILSFQARSYQKALTEETLSAQVKEAQYAVRGAIPQRGEEINLLLKQGEVFPFNKTTPCNIGNPQAVGQGHFTFNREVLACLIHPGLMKTDAISADAKARAAHFMEKLPTPMGAYTSSSRGHDYVRQTIKTYIEKRDGSAVSVNPDNIYLTNGASEGVKLAFRMLLTGEKDGVMVPIPQYPLYSAQLTLDGGTMVKYYLDENKNWGIDLKDIEYRIHHAKELGINLKAMVLINPGNPTGNVLTRSDIEDIIKIAHDNSMVIIADEVYQTNIYTEEAPFISTRKVLAEMDAKYADNVELISLHSTSKGLTGECGLRGGYIEAHNFDKYVSEQMFKLKSIDLCSNTVGQVAAALMVDPPKAGRESAECVALYEKEKSQIFDGLKERAELLTQTFNEMTNYSCQQIQGAMYAFPRVHFSEKAVAEAKKRGVAVDFMYCMDMVNETGIMTVPGSGFGQKEGEYHYRITNLVTPTSDMQKTLDILKSFNEKWHKKFE